MLYVSSKAYFHSALAS